jgi:teichuronic acid biosynthesis protein TuaE
MKAAASTSLRSSPSASLLLLSSVIATSLAIGTMVAISPIVTILLLLISIGIAIALTKPALLFAAGIVLLAVEPAGIFGADSVAGHATTYKLVLYACTLPLLLNRGIAPRKCGPLGAYLVVTIFTEWLGTPLPGLTTAQTTATLATLSLAWLVFAIDWDWRRDHFLLKVLAWVPILSVLIGLALQVVGILSLFRDTSPPRLEGATLAAWLGSFSVCAVIACLALYRRDQWKWARWLGFADVVILAGTVTRGAALALAIVAVPSLARFGREQLSAKGTNGVVKLAIAVAIAAVVATVLIPILLERNENATVYVAGKGSAREISSGRFRAWAFAYEQAKVNLAFGRGVGAGPIVGKSPGSPADFTAQHNEYVRMVLEVGLAGGVILLITMMTTLTSVIRRAPMLIRADLAAAGVALTIYSLTENTLSATPIAMAWLLAFGIAGSRVKRPEAIPTAS